jgi:hypothetical protein
MDNALYYTFSTISQIVAGAIALRPLDATLCAATYAPAVSHGWQFTDSETPKVK